MRPFCSPFIGSSLDTGNSPCNSPCNSLTIGSSPDNSLTFSSSPGNSLTFGSRPDIGNSPPYGNSPTFGNRLAKANFPSDAYSSNAFNCGYKQRHPSPVSGVLYGECLKNHSSKIGDQVLDGCRKFVPSVVDICICGCPRTFHRINQNSRSIFNEEGDAQECLHNHGARFGSQVFDGCKKFTLAVNSCNCGCPRIMHRITQNPSSC